MIYLFNSSVFLMLLDVSTYLKDLFTVSFIVKDNEKNKWGNECDTLAKINPIRTA